MAGGHLPDGHLPTGHLPEGHLPELAAGAPVTVLIPRRFIHARSMVRRWIIGMNEQIGAPYGVVEPKRSFAEVAVGIDWHDYLAKRRIPGVYVETDTIFRPLRAEATGYQYRCTTAGTCSGKEFGKLRWPTTNGGTITDGTAVWTAEAIADTSLRTTIASATWPAVSGLTLSSEQNSDQRYQVLAASGLSGRSYVVKHQIVCANGEDAEGVIILPVQD